nr:MAG TPA: hypothetical protein [Caudoviricetes sp.]
MRKQSIYTAWDKFLFGVYQKYGFWPWFTIVAVKRILLLIIYIFFFMPILIVVVFLWEVIEAFIKVVKEIFITVFDDLKKQIGYIFELRLAFTKHQEIEQAVRRHLARWKERNEQNN